MDREIPKEVRQKERNKDVYKRQEKAYKKSDVYLEVLSYLVILIAVGI